jgi:hypothetical protein
MQCHGRTIFVDHYFGFMFNRNQVSVWARETATTKHAFDRFTRDHRVKLQHFRLDNSPLDCDEFKEELAHQGQTVDFSGVSTHHQNGVAEHVQGAVMTWTYIQMMHQLLHWPDQADKSLWPCALDNAAHIWNHLPDCTSELSPHEQFLVKKPPQGSRPLLST